MENLSAMTPLQSVIGYSSMAAGNTISDETGSMTAPGTPSETTGFAAQVRSPVVQSSDGQIPVGTPPDRKADNDSYDPAPDSWKMLPGNGMSSPEA